MIKKIKFFIALIALLVVAFLTYEAPLVQNEVKLNSDVIFNLFGFPINNSMTALWATMLILLVIALFIKINLSLKPGKTQLIAEVIISFFNEKLLIANNQDSKDTKLFLPLVLTVFLLFLIGNQFALLPFLTSFQANGVPMFKTPSTDFSLTLAATILIVVMSHLVVLFRKPIRHFLNYVKVDKIFKIRSVKEIPNVLLELFLGIMDIVSEFAKIISMSARIFGNVAAGELMVLVIAGLSLFTVYVVPIPFIFLGSFSGLVQAFVFGLLAVQFSALTLNSVKESNT